MQLWGSAKKSNTNKIQAFQNLTLHNDFHMKTINDEAQSFYLRFGIRLLSHQNPLIKNLYQEIQGAG